TADGTVVGVSSTQILGPVKIVALGKVEGKQLVVRGADGKELERLPWDDTAVGLYAQERMWQQKKVKPGDRFNFTNYELAIKKALLVRVVVGEMEDADVLEVKKDDPKAKAERVRKKLLRVEATADKVDIEGVPFQLPKIVSWLDADRQVVRTETEMPGL